MKQTRKRAIQKNGLLMAVVFAFFLAACQKEEQTEPSAQESVKEQTDAQKLDQWKLADWIHDIDAAKRVQESALRGDFGPLTEDLVSKLDVSEQARTHAFTTARKCWPRREGGIDSRIFDTAHTDHACLDAQGYKRSR
ncbi:MAG: hypothetical protein LBB55_03905 [Zoogloeaceae bacterium]|jgi:hypothetical protein|nr:hypothetical protein [Zoogloeaceae bacterium]